MKPRIGRWLVCSSVTALAACLNPLPDDTPSRAGTSAGPEVLLPGNTPPPQPNGAAGIPGPPGAPNLLPDGVGEGSPDSEELLDDDGSGSTDAGALDAGALQTSETTAERDLAPDAGSGSSE